MRAYLDWEYRLVAQLERDGTHGFTVLVPYVPYCPIRTRP
jgi:hypothetical protein